MPGHVTSVAPHMTEHCGASLIPDVLDTPAYEVRVVSTDEKAAGVSHNTEPAEQRSRLRRFTACVVRLPGVVMEWVTDLIEGLSTRIKNRCSGRASGVSLERLAEGHPLSPGVLKKLAAQGGELRALYNKLQWIGLHGGDGFTGQARELLEADIEGVAARDWALGGRSAAQLVKQCGENTQAYLGAALAQWAVSVEALFNAAWSSKTPVTASELGCLLEGLQQVQESDLDWDFKAEAYLLAGRSMGEIPVQAWAIEQGAGYLWLASARDADKADVVEGLRRWRDDAVELLGDAWRRTEAWRDQDRALGALQGPV